MTPRQVQVPPLGLHLLRLAPILLVIIAFIPHRMLIHGQSLSASETGQSYNVHSTFKCPSDILPKKRIVCFYRVEDEFRPYDIDPCLCTHIVYSYVAVKENFAFIAGKKGDLKYLSALRNKNPYAKIIVSLRPTGSLFTLEDPKNITYPLPPTNTLRHRFSKRIKDFLTRHGLDGVDIDYEYFKQEQHSNNRKREYLISIIQSISSSIKLSNEANKPILTLTTSRYPRHLADYYDFSEIYKYVDFVNVPAFNFDQDGKSLIHPAKLHGISEMENMDAIIDLAFALGLPSDQLVVGVPTFGTLYRLANQSETTPGSMSISWSEHNQPITTISHSKICEVREKSNWTLVRESDLTAPYIYVNDKWIGFDDEISIKLKAKYVVLRQTGGLAFFHLNDDDPSGQCGLGSYPLVQSALSVFTKSIDRINSQHSVETVFSNSSQRFFLSFLDIVEKHGNVERVTEDDEENSIQSLSCDKMGYQRHPEDCTRFYRCLKFNPNDFEFQKLQYSCPVGLVFDEKYQICNWPSWSPSCVGSGEITPTTKKSFICPKAGYFQDSENCEYFHYCSDLGKSFLQSYEFKCPFELGFDQEKLQCNWKWLVKGCQYVPPEERIIRDLQQIIPQDVSAGDNDQLDVSASDMSEIYREFPEEFSDYAQDEFEERSDSSQGLAFKILKNIEGKLNPLQYLQGLNLDKVSQSTQQPASRLQALTSYISKLMSRLRGSFASPSTLESRSDRSKSGTWIKPLNHLIPKFKPFRKSKSDAHKKSKSSIKVKTVKTKKMGFDKNPFKLPKLTKLGKKNKLSSKSSKSEHSTSTTKLPTHYNPQIHKFPQRMMVDQVVPMFVEESIHVPQFIKPPSNFAFNQYPHLNKPFNGRIMQAESSIKPVRVQPNVNNNNNKYFNKLNEFHNKNIQAHVNVMNDFQVASSYAINTFGQQQQSTVAKDTFQFVPTKAPSFSYFYQEPSKPVRNTPKSRRITSSTGASQPKNNFNIPNKPSASNVFPDVKPYRHSYGLPSVNIRYSYSDDVQQNKPKQSQQFYQPQHSPTRPKHIKQQPSSPVKIETTKLNFPQAIIGSDSADAQLESFLRDKFIINNQPVKPSNIETMQPTAYRQSPTTAKPLVYQETRTNKPKAHKVESGPAMSSFISNRMPSSQTVHSSSKPLQTKPKQTNLFSSFVSGEDPFLTEREKFFKDFNTRQREHASLSNPKNIQPSVSILETPVVMKPKYQNTNLPKKPSINYKLTPISDTVFEINNHSTARPKVQESYLSTEAPLVLHSFANRDPVSQAVHNANRFEYIRSTQKPAIKYESYEWTTPTSLANDKIKVNFNLMTPKDITEEINKKKYLFTDNTSFKPVDSPISTNKHNFFPEIGDIFANYQTSASPNSANRDHENSFSDSIVPFKPTTAATPNSYHSVEYEHNNEEAKTTTQSPRWVIKANDEESARPVTSQLNDTNEYIMLMLNNQKDHVVGKSIDEQLRDLIDSTRQLGKVYNVESDNGQTLFALLPKFGHENTPDTANTPFIYKGENAFIRNISGVQYSPPNQNDVLRLDISKPDSQVLHSIFDKMKDELSASDQLLPASEESDLINYNPHQAHRLPQDSNRFNPTVSPTSQSTYSTSRAPPSSSESPNQHWEGTTEKPWYHHLESGAQRSKPAAEGYPVETVYEFNSDKQENQKLNRSSNVWYDDVSKAHRPFDNINSYDVITSDISTESPATIKTTLAFTATSRHFTRHSKPTTVSTTTTTTTTQAPTTAYTRASKPPRRPQLRRKPEYGVRQNSATKPIVLESDHDQETKPQSVSTTNRPEAPVDYLNQNNFGQKLNNRQPPLIKNTDSYAEVSSTERPIFYEEELPNFSELNYPETQNIHNPAKEVTVSTTTEPAPVPVSDSVSEKPAIANENAYYPDSTIHNLKPDKTGIPESACTRPGIFQHPNDCNKYYECYWDKHINKFTLQPFECPVKLAFDTRIIGCGSPNDPTVCVQY